MKPLCIELFCGMFGWSQGWLELGGRVIGFDIEHLPHHGAVPTGADLVLQDVLTIDGSKFKHADLILASPPCTEFSYMAMPWSRGRQIAKAIRGEGAFPEGYKGSQTIDQLRALFDACFRIQREASKAAGRHIPMVVENVRGAQSWVGRARANYGSFYLYGDVPELIPKPFKLAKVPGMGHGWRPPSDPKHVPGLSFNGSSERAWKLESAKGRRTDVGNGVRFTSRDCGIEGIKEPNARKAASARIAKIPTVLARHVARWYYPEAL